MASPKGWIPVLPVNLYQIVEHWAKQTQFRTLAELKAPQTKPQIPRSKLKSTPDLKLTISPSLLNTLISSATNPIPTTSSSIFSAPIGTSVAPAIDSHNFQEATITDSSLAHFHESLPAPLPQPLFSSPHFHHFHHKLTIQLRTKTLLYRKFSETSTHLPMEIPVTWITHSNIQCPQLPETSTSVIPPRIQILRQPLPA